jgi:hypothetical protein
MAGEGSQGDKGRSVTFWGPTLSMRRRFVLDLLMLSLCGVALFMITTRLVEPFSQIVGMLEHTSLREEWRVGVRVLALALPMGLLWLGFFVVFEAVKEDLVALVTVHQRKAPSPPWPVSPARRRNALALQRRALLVQRRVGRGRRSL